MKEYSDQHLLDLIKYYQKFEGQYMNFSYAGGDYINIGSAGSQLGQTINIHKFKRYLYGEMVYDYASVKELNDTIERWDKGLKFEQELKKLIK